MSSPDTSRGVAVTFTLLFVLLTSLLSSSSSSTSSVVVFGFPIIVLHTNKVPPTTTTSSSSSSSRPRPRSNMVSPAISTIVSPTAATTFQPATGTFPSLAAAPSSTMMSSGGGSVNKNNLRFRHNGASILSHRGGAAAASSSSSAAVIKSSSSSSTALYTAAGSDESNVNKKCPFTKTMAIFGSFWGSLGVVYVLAKAIKRVLPIAMEPIKAGTQTTFTPVQWSLYALSCLFFAYAEGYKGFHKKFSPLVVKRSFTLLIGTSQGNNPLNYLLAPLYSMGLIHATKKRMITSWSVTIGVATIVAIVKRLPLVPRIILDAGVVVGLGLGSASILYYFIKSFITGNAPDVDACLPVPTNTKK
mmetsp:Transcript_9166/g.23212  ORF Transcript_9166/g.23212 Transcript_9166/m.23212 type:complete len:359 (+) Transcript_9166:222-1298(+)